MCNEEYTDPRQRQLFKNVHVTSCAERAARHGLHRLRETDCRAVPGKDKLIGANSMRSRLVMNAPRQTLPCPIGLRVERSDGVGKRIFINGNDACGLGAIYGGATVAAWVSDHAVDLVIEAFKQLLPASSAPTRTTAWRAMRWFRPKTNWPRSAMVIGASWNGARAFTATSGPGISLMQEFFGLAYFAEVAGVHLQRPACGPSTGMPTKTQQSDLIACAYASHGDTKHVMLFRKTVRVLYFRSAGFRSGRAFADAGLRHVRPGYRDERSSVPALRLGRQPSLYAAR